MPAYQILTFYSPFRDAECKRISVFDGRGGEYWTVVEKPRKGQTWRELREQTLALLHDAVEAGKEPGEVIINEHQSDAAI